MSLTAPSPPERAPTPSFQASCREDKALSESTAHSLGPRGTEPPGLPTASPQLAT